MTEVLFVCVHNAGRSQMAEAIFNAEVAKRGLSYLGVSAGTKAGTGVNPAALEALNEIGVPVAGLHPKQLTQDMANRAAKILTMGCGVDEESCPGRIHVSEDWALVDPAGKGIEAVREIRDQIHKRVLDLIFDLENGH